jgi:hypothetical protein
LKLLQDYFSPSSKSIPISLKAMNAIKKRISMLKNGGYTSLVYSPGGGYFSGFSILKFKSNSNG